MQVRIVPLPGKRVEHQGIKVQLIGQIELAAERNAVRSNPHDFVSLGAQHIHGLPTGSGVLPCE